MHRSGRRKKMDTRTNFVKVKLVNPGHTVTTVFRPYIAWERGLPAYFSFLKSTGIAFTKDIIVMHSGFFQLSLSNPGKFEVWLKTETRN